MSLKEDIGMVKEELSSEEKFFEKAVVTEKFVKKYKNILIGSLVVIVIGVGGNLIYKANENSRVEAANAALLILQKDVNNTEAAADLKSLSPKLYDVWMLSSAIMKGDFKALEDLKSSKTDLVGDIASYELAQNSKDLSALEKYASKKDALYRDLALVESAVLLMDKGDTQKAHQELAKISVNSPLSKVANALLHYGVK